MCTPGCARMQRALPSLAAASVRASPSVSSSTTSWRTCAPLLTSGKTLEISKNATPLVAAIFCNLTLKKISSSEGQDLFILIRPLMMKLWL